MKKKTIQLYHSDGTKAPWYNGWDLTEEQRDIYRKRSIESKLAKTNAIKNGIKSIHPIYVPNLNPLDLMPKLSSNTLKSLSVFSGCGGLDIGFERAGFSHVASFELFERFSETLQVNRPHWNVYGGEEGDVRLVNWKKFEGAVDVVHGGPPCQPFSSAGRQKGEEDSRDMIPEFIRAIGELKPKAFVMENVYALTSKKFSSYLKNQIFIPLKNKGYKLHFFELKAEHFGVPQIRKRIFLVGFRDSNSHKKYKLPQPTHCSEHLGSNSEQALPFESMQTMGVRKALGLPDIGFDALAPTIRSGLTGPRHTTSILSSASAQKKWEKLKIWPNGVALTKEKAQAFPAKHDFYRLSIPDCAIMQGFPPEWFFGKAVYIALGQIGNSVAPPVAYHVAVSVKNAILD